MSKCQKNKYFIGSCPGVKVENKGFQQDLALLMAARNAQDSRIQADPQAKAEAKPQVVQVPKDSGSKESRSADIDLILGIP